MAENSKLILKVSGMHCAACAAGIERGLTRLEGVQRAQVNFATATAQVEYALDQNAILEKIGKLGYSAEPQDQSRPGFTSEAPHARRNFFWGLILTIPVMLIGMSDMWFGTMLFDFTAMGVILALLALPVLAFAGREIYIDAWKRLLRFSANMNSLIALGATAAYFYSVYVLIDYQFVGALAEYHYYFESSAMIITLILLGRFLESRAKDRARDAIGALIRLRPERTTAVIDDQEVEIDTAAVIKGMILVVRPGEKVPADGVVIEGNTSINEAMITGESIPVEKKKGDKVIGGSVNGNSSFRMTVTGAGEDSFLSGIIRLVSEAQNKKAPIQKLADTIAGIFVPIIILISLATFIVWFFIDRTSPMLITAPVAVLIIACPCALGLATPTAILAGTGRAARMGIYIRGGDILETVNKITHILFDKTGTLTEGRFGVVATKLVDESKEEKMLQLAASAESESNHPLAIAIVEKAKEGQVKLRRVKNLTEYPGFGLNAEVDGYQVLVGNAATMKKNGIDLEPLLKTAADEMAKGRTVVYTAANGELLGFFALADKIRDEAPGVMSKLAAKGYEVIILTGDNFQTARGVAKVLGVGRFEAEVKPDKKSVIVETYHRAGSMTMMVGDGINDAPALAAADVGVALGSGTDVAIESADIILVRNDLETLLQALNVSRATYRTIKQNLFWAFIYNIIAVPLAAGVLYPVLGWSLSPVFAAGIMALSSLFVVSNSLRLLHVKGIA